MICHQTCAWAELLLHFAGCVHRWAVITNEQFQFHLKQTISGFPFKSRAFSARSQLTASATHHHLPRDAARKDNKGRQEPVKTLHKKQI
jgi:hypothetical protein